MVRKWSNEDFQHLNVEERLELIDALTDRIEKRDDDLGRTHSEQRIARILARKPSNPSFQKVTVDELIEFIGDVWDSIPPEAMPPLNHEQQRELERRLADYEKNPSDSVPWEDVKAELMKRLSP